MTGRDVYRRAAALLGQEERDAAYFEPIALSCLNQMLADCLWQENALCKAFHRAPYHAPPELLSLEDEVPYDERMVSTCFPYRLAALLIAGENRREYSRLSQEYEQRIANFEPCRITEMQVSV